VSTLLFHVIFSKFFFRKHTLQTKNKTNFVTAYKNVYTNLNHKT